MVTKNALLCVKTAFLDSPSIRLINAFAWQHFCDSLDAILALHTNGDGPDDDAMDCAREVTEQITYLHVTQCAYLIAHMGDQ